jgi:hypothetical protein
MPPERSKLWSLALGGQPIDADAWADALDAAAADPSHDFRTRLLIRDGVDALASHWRIDRVEAWLAASPARRPLRDVWRSDLGEPGFPSLARRLVDATRPGTVLQFFRALGEAASRPARLDVGGSTALILRDLLARHTEDIDVVDEVPPDLRADHDLLHRLAGRFGLHLAHFQSHYLPSGWRERVGSLGRFGKLDVFLVDALDVLVGKLFSGREKDQDDLRAVAGKVDKALFAARLATAGATFLAEPKLAEHARSNWYVVYGEPLPGAT